MLYIGFSSTNQLGNQVKHLLILLFLLLLSSPLFGQSTSKYESVGQCVLQTMTEKKLTGNETFELVKEECERILGKVETVVKKRQKGVLFFINRNRIVGWYEDGDEKKDGKYVGEIENRKPNGQGTHTYSNGEIYVGKWKGGSPWIGTKYNKNGKTLGKWVNGKFQ
jgi:hypothetical protein